MMFAIVVNYGDFFLHLKITCIKASTGPYMAIPWFIKICIFFLGFISCFCYCIAVFSAPKAKVLEILSLVQGGGQ